MRWELNKGSEKHRQEKESKRKHRELNKGSEKHEREKEAKRTAAKSTYINNKKLNLGKRVDNFRQKNMRVRLTYA